MNNKEREILKKVVDQGGLLPPVDVINIFAGHDRKPVDNLVVKGFLEEVPKEIKGIKLGTYTTENFYRATEKGLLVFSPWYTRAWGKIKDDLHTITVSVITATVTSLVVILLENIF